MTDLGDLFVVGKPVLLHAGSANGARMMAMEEAWRKDLEPRELDMELLDVALLDSSWASFNPGDFVIVTEARRADQATQERLATLMHDPDKTVVVADCEVPKFLRPEKFSHYAKF